jgi:hypothetical protein
MVRWARWMAKIIEPMAQGWVRVRIIVWAAVYDRGVSPAVEHRRVHLLKHRLRLLLQLVLCPPSIAYKEINLRNSLTLRIFQILL